MTKDEFDDEQDDYVRDDERDLPAEADMDDDDDPATVPCPYCGRKLLEEADVCPHCKNYISFEDAPRRHSWWMIAIVVVLLIVVLLWAI